MSLVLWIISGCVETSSPQRAGHEAQAPAPPPASPAAPARASVRAQTGGVSIKRRIAGGWTKAERGTQLYEGDKVRTAPDASAEIEFSDGSVVVVAEDALVTIAEEQPGLGTPDVTLVRGHLDAELASPGRQRLHVVTPSASVAAGREIAFQ